MVDDKPYLILGRVDKNMPLSFHCSLCGEAFALSEGKTTPEEAVVELWATFTAHIQQEHSKAMG